MEEEQYTLQQILPSRTLQTAHLPIIMPVILYIHQYQF